MIQGVKKFSELSLLTPNGTERLPAIQNVGGVFVNGYIDMSSVSGNLYNSDGTLTGNRTVSLDGNSLSIKDEVDPTDKCEIEINYNYARIWKLLAGIASGFQVTDSSAELSIGDSNAIPTTSWVKSLLSGVNIYSESPLTSNPTLPSSRQISVESEKIRLIGVGANNEVRFFDETEPSAAMNMMPTDKGILIPRLTEAQMNAIPSPANYLEVVNTTRGIKMYYDPFFGWTPQGVVQPYWGFESIEECNSFDNGYWRYQKDAVMLVPGYGVALSGSLGIPIVEHNLRIPHHNTGFHSLIKFKTSASLYDYSNQSMIVGGITELNNFSLLLSGVFFLIDDFGTINWSEYVQICCSNNGDSARTLLETTVLVSSLTSDTRFEIRTNDFDGVAKFYIDDALVGSINTNYPISKSLYWGTYFNDPLGIGVNLRYSHFKQKFVTPR